MLRKVHSCRQLLTTSVKIVFVIIKSKESCRDISIQQRKLVHRALLFRCYLYHTSLYANKLRMHANEDLTRRYVIVRLGTTRLWSSYNCPNTKYKSNT